MRAKSDTYNDETRVKHTVYQRLRVKEMGLFLVLQVVVVEEVDYYKHCANMISELEAAGCQIPAKVDQSLYKK